jgi:hypothetical protein
MPTLKAPALEQLKRLREAANAGEPVAETVIRVIALMYEDTKESLVTAQAQDIQAVQGEAMLLKRLHKELTTNPPHIGPGVTK